MKIKVLTFLACIIFGVAASAQPTTPINNGAFTGVSHIKSGASLIADPGSILTGFPGTGTVTSINFSGGSSGLVITGGPIVGSGTLTITSGVLAKAFGGNGTATPALTQGTGITITGSWPNYTINATNAGTVTSAALTMPSILSVAGSPITSSGTFAVTLATQSANTVFAGPASGSAATPTFRALVAADIPDISGVYQPLNSNLTAIAALSTTSYGRSVLIQANAAALRSLAGLGTLATQNGTFSGTSSGTNTGDQTTISGNAGTATSLQTARTINGVNFNGTANITVTAAAGTLTGATLAAGVINSSLQNAAGGTFGTAAFTNATAYEVPLTFSTGLNRATNTITVVADAGLPSQTSNSGKFLTTNGSVSSWAMISATGTVTSVAASVPAFLSISGSPITTSGTLAISYSGTALPIANGGTSGTTKAGAFDALSPMTTSGDIIYGGTSGTGTRLPKGTDGQVLTLASGLPSWTTVTGTGTVTTSGSPSSGQAAEFTGSTVITGVAVSGTGSYAKVGSPTFTTQITSPKNVFTTSVFDTFGSGTPEGAITANIGSVFRRTDGSTGTTLYVKESGTGNTGWAPVSGGSGSPGGSNTQLQYNNSSAFGGISGATSNGTAVTFTGGNLIATSPKIITAINDTNGNALITITATGSAVNAVTLANAATGSSPTLTASGSDSNIGFTFVPKGTGVFTIAGTAASTYLHINSTTGSPNAGFSLDENGSSKWALASYLSGTFTFYNNGLGAEAMNISATNIATWGNTTDASSSSTASVIFSGGVGIAKKLIINDSITTAAPSGGTAGAWKFGIAVTGVTSTFVATNYLQVDIAGTMYKIATVTSVP